MAEKRLENLIIIGGACAGYTAAIYASRANLEPLVIEGFQWGGQLQNTTDVENYPGFPEGIMGPEMMNAFRAQAERFGTRFISDDATRVELSDGGIQRVWVGDDEYSAKAVILAMGADPKTIGVPGEAELGGRGVSYCGVCDGAFFKDKDVVVIGGGDSAMEESTFVAKFAKQADDRQPARRLPRLEDHVRAGRAVSTTSSSRRRSPSIGSSPATTALSTISSFATRRRARPRSSRPAAPSSRSAIPPARHCVEGQIDLHPNGYVKVEEPSTRTNLAGVFAVGDLVDYTYRQAVTAAGAAPRGRSTPSGTCATRRRPRRKRRSSEAATDPRLRASAPPRLGRWIAGPGRRCSLMAAIWGASYLLIKISLRDFDPVVVSWARVALGVGVLVPFAYAAGALPAIRAKIWMIALSGWSRWLAPSS